ncbi:MAG: hypothetical protein HY608_06920 [Planctomycetes bacterium]|nr:hypothetical protein [Planctomycetota bacterium]
MRYAGMLGAFLIAWASMGVTARASEESKEGRKRLRDALSSGRDERVQEAAIALAQLRSTDALEALLGEIKSDLPTAHYWAVLAAIGSFEGPDSIVALAEWIGKSGTDESMAFDLMTLLASRNFSTASGVCFQVAQTTGARARPLVARAIMEAGRLPPNMAVDTLTRLLERVTENETKALIAARLQEITGGNGGSDANVWRQAWEVRRAQTGSTGDQHDFLSDYERARAPQPGQLVVIECACSMHERLGTIVNFDHIDQALAGLNIPCRVIKKEEFESPSFSLDDVAMILINCNQFKDH